MSTSAYELESLPTQYTNVVWVTPEVAQEWLETLNVENRNLSRVVSKRWADVFSLGRYRLTHQGIAFDEAGNLVDGQHRLWGLAHSTCSGVWMQVTYEVQRSGFVVMDTGHMRQAGHLIPAPHANVKAAAMRLLQNYPVVAPATERVENETVLATYEDLKTYVEAAIDLAAGPYRNAGITFPIHTAVLTVVLASEHPRDRIEAWVEGLTTGAGLEANDPRLALRNRFAVEGRHFNSSSGSGRHDATYLIVRAWNAWARGESLSKLQLPRGGTGVGTIPEVAR